VICVPTPLTADNGPDLGAVRSAAAMAARRLRPGALVVLESTTYPGTTEEVVRPLLEKGSGLTAGLDFSLAFSPERIDPGNPAFSIRNTPKVVGGVTPSCTDAAAAFYGTICDDVVRAASAREAEMAKLLENTYRHVNIALVNEMAIFCHELGVDLWTRSGAPPPSRSGSSPSSPVPASAVTASRSTPTTSPTRCAGSATRSGSSSWHRRSTAGCPGTSCPAPPSC
jgi:nucleotide sugar dehydrogenase